MAALDLGKVTLSEEEKANMMPKTGGTFSGPVVAHNTTDMTSQVRNITFATAVPETILDGEIVFVFEE